jgi:hypothetical protein
MHVDVHPRGLEVHEEHPHRLAARRERGGEAAVDREVERPVPHVSAVHEDVERSSRGKAELGRGDDSVDVQPEPCAPRGEGGTAPPPGPSAVAMRSRRSPGLAGEPGPCARRARAGRRPRVGERQPQHGVLDVLQLGLGAAEELAASGHLRRRDPPPGPACPGRAGPAILAAHPRRRGPRFPRGAPCSEVRRTRRETEAMAASASPRNPRVRMARDLLRRAACSWRDGGC